MSPRFLMTIVAAAVFCFPMTACNLDTKAKTLTKKSFSSSADSTAVADVFSISLAYRDPSNDATSPNRSVSLQGPRGNSAANLVNQCGATGNTCTCDFYQSSTDTNYQTSTSSGISQQNNSFSCIVPSTVSDANVKTIKFVRLRRTDVTAKDTGLIPLTLKLTIDDILGSTLSKTKVRGVFRYSCTRTFFEGEGVSTSQVTCVAGQHLGVISASYNFYVFRSGEDSNSPGGDSGFQEAICSRNDFLKVRCTGNTPELRFGLYKEGVEPFIVGLQMSRAPEGDNLSANYGYAALPDSAGNCPTGLIKIRPWEAQPASIIQGSLNGVNPPSSFLNSNNSLNNKVVEQSQPPNFVVTRQPNLIPCSSKDGTCTGAAFDGPQQAQSVAYTPLTPVVCAIPPELLSGLF